MLSFYLDGHKSQLLQGESVLSRMKKPQNTYAAKDHQAKCCENITECCKQWLKMHQNHQMLLSNNDKWILELFKLDTCQNEFVR